MRWKPFFDWRRWRGPLHLPDILPELDDHILRDIGFVRGVGPARSHIWPLSG